MTKVEVENLDRTGTPDATTPWIETLLVYDEIGRLTSKTVDLTSTSTATTSFEYEGSGSLVKVTHPEGNEDEFAWDERHLLFTATRGANDATLASTVQFDHDLNGNLAQTTDGRGNATTYTSDLFDRRTQATDALSAYVALTFDQVYRPRRFDIGARGPLPAASAVRSRETLDGGGSRSASLPTRFRQILPGPDEGNGAASRWHAQRIQPASAGTTLRP